MYLSRASTRGSYSRIEGVTVHKTKNYSAYSYEYYSPHARLFARAPKPKFSVAALRLIASKPLLKMWVVKKA